MLIKTIVDSEIGNKFEIYKKSDDEFFYKYYEYFEQIGWRLISIVGDIVNGYFSKDAIEWEFDFKIISKHY